MTRWRIAVAGFLLLALGVPLGMPFVDLLSRPAGWHAWGEAPRLVHLLANTLLLVGGTLLVALPAGTFLAVLLYRTDLPLRGSLRALLLLTLLVPLPLLASGWQTFMGGTGNPRLMAIWNLSFPTSDLPNEGNFAFQRWGQGVAALWIHVAAALPWVVLLVGQGLRWVERELEEDALTATGTWRVLWHVTLPRSRAALAAAAVWVGVQVAGEIAITDMMQVRTFAEEVYTQMVRPAVATGLGDERDMVARALAVTLPEVVATVVLTCWAAVLWERRLPPFAALLAPPRPLPLGLARWPAWLVSVALILLVAGVPLGSLLWRAGLTSGEHWSTATVVHELGIAWRLHGPIVVESLACAAGAGLALAALALVVCWLATRSRWFLILLLVLSATTWVMPGPVIGLGLKAAIELILDITGSKLLERILYLGPSPAPVLWAYLVRCFPFAIALTWPVIRLFPPRLRESAEVDGATPGRVLMRVVVPLTWPAAARAAVAVAILALGELSASKLVDTAGDETFAHKVFEQMHYGIGGPLAALCLILLAAVTLGAVVLAVVDRLVRKRLSLY